MFHVDSSHSSVVLEKLLGKDYAGIISCDFFGAYRKFERLTNAELQFCRAHFIREVKFLAENKGKKVARYGKRLLSAIEPMFRTIYRRGVILDRTWHRRMEEHRKLILRAAWQRLPKEKDAGLPAERLRNWQNDYFRFIAGDLPLANNVAEQSIAGWS